MSVPIFVEFRGGLTDFVAKMGVVNGELDKMALKGAATTSKLAVVGKAAALGIAAVGVGVAVESVKMAGDFQQATNVLVTAAGESTKNLKLVRNGILDIASSTGTSWRQVTDGMYLLEKAGYRGADALNVERVAAQGAREENASLATVTQAMTSIMASYHLKASDSVAVMNQLKTAAGESKTTMEEFSGALSTVLPIASANKISFADVAGALATLTQHGTSADEATQELSNTIRNLAAPNAVAVKEMAQLGISAQDVSRHLGKLGVTGTLDYLSETVLSKLGPSGKVLLNTFFQSKAAAQDLNDMLAKMPPQAQKLAQAYHDGTITVADYRKEIKALPTDQYAAAVQFATLQNTANGFNTAIRQGLPGTQTYTEAIKKMTGGANGLNTTLQITGESTAATTERVKRVADAAKNAGRDVSGWASTQNLMNVRLDMWKQSIEAAAIKLGMMLIPYVLQAMDAIQGLAGWFEKHRTTALALAAAIGGVLAGVIVAYTASMVAAAAATVAATWPVLAVVAALAALSAGFYYAWTHSATFRDVVISTAEAVRSTFGVVVAWFTGVALPDLQHAFHVAWQAIGASVQWFIDNPLKWIKQRVAEFQAFWNAHGQELKDVAHTAWTFISRVVQVAWILIYDGILRPGLVALKSVWDVAWAAIHGVVKMAWDIIKTVVTTGYKLVLDVIGVFLDLLDGHWSQAWKDIKQTVSDAWAGLKTLITGWLSDAGHLLYDVGKAIISGMIDGIKSMFGSVKNTLGDLTNKLTSWKGPPERDAMLLHGSGRLIIGSLINGMESMYPSVAASLGGLTESVGATKFPLIGGPGTSGGSTPVSAGRRGSAGGETHVHVHFEGAVIGGTKADAEKLGEYVADGVRSSLLSKKRSGAVTTLGLS